ncbi:SMP-30/gluconolactonase/LRE family protein [Actinomycetospora sp. OC33-EN08]|uniref:SMP-30/gluconolactonase/LRE family protein n=1 Tax=Actinomycetospora aurantiaca TaxID=3129233 RepID=A0ABU8MG56_9PSEU
MTEYLPTPTTLLDGLAMVESGRWHDDRLWFAHWVAGEVIAADPSSGRTEVVARGPERMGWAIDWLPDGRLLVSGDETTVHGPDGSSARFSEQGGNEIVVDPRGHVYVNGADFDFLGGGAPEPGWIRLLGPDGSVRQVATDIDFPNGMLVTPDGSTLVVAESFAGRLSAFDIDDDGSLSRRRVWAEGLGPDGICVDAEGGIWCQTADTFAHGGSGPAGAVVRVLEGGEITHRVETDQPCFACALGGPDGRDLYLLCNDWEGIEAAYAVTEQRTARVLVTRAPVGR